MRQLLERWAALEPDKCVRNWPRDLNDHAFQAGLLYATIKAVELHMWSWELKYDKSSGRYYAHVADGSKNGRRCQPGGHISPSEALLYAYLEALEAAAGDLV